MMLTIRWHKDLENNLQQERRHFCSSFTTSQWQKYLKFTPVIDSRIYQYITLLERYDLPTQIQANPIALRYTRIPAPEPLENITQVSLRNANAAIFD